MNQKVHERQLRTKQSFGNTDRVLVAFVYGRLCVIFYTPSFIFSRTAAPIAYKAANAMQTPNTKPLHRRYPLINHIIMKTMPRGASIPRREALLTHSQKKLSLPRRSLAGENAHGVPALGRVLDRDLDQLGRGVQVLLRRWRQRRWTEKGVRWWRKAHSKH